MKRKKMLRRGGLAQILGNARQIRRWALSSIKPGPLKKQYHTNPKRKNTKQPPSSCFMKRRKSQPPSQMPHVLSPSNFALLLFFHAKLHGYSLFSDSWTNSLLVRTVNEHDRKKTSLSVTQATRLLHLYLYLRHCLDSSCFHGSSHALFCNYTWTKPNERQHNSSPMIYFANNSHVRPYLSQTLLPAHNLTHVNLPPTIYGQLVYRCSQRNVTNKTHSRILPRLTELSLGSALFLTRFNEN